MSKYNFFIILISINLFVACNEKTVDANNENQTNSENINLISLSSEQIKTAGILLENLQQKELSASTKANGMVSVLNENKAQITSLFGGTVKSINVHSGALVKTGDIIAMIANPLFIAAQEEYLTIQSQLNAGNPDAVASITNPQYAALQEQYLALQPQIDLAEKELERQKMLNSGNAGSIKNLQQAETNLSSLNAKLNAIHSQMIVFSKNAHSILKTKMAALESKLKMMGINPQNLTAENLQNTIAIRTPISGKVGEINAKIGAFVSESNPITDVIDLNNVHIDLNVYEIDIPKFKVGQMIDFIITNNPTKKFRAEVHNIGAMLDPVSKTAEVHAHIEGDKSGLLEGMNVTAIINLGKNKVLAVPNNAIVNEGDKDFIFIVKNESDKEVVFEKTIIVKGVTEGDYSQINLISPLPNNVKIANNQAFFILGKMNNNGEEE